MQLSLPLTFQNTNKALAFNNDTLKGLWDFIQKLYCSFIEKFCNKTPKRLSKICQNRSSRWYKPKISVGGGGGLTVPQDPQLDFWYVSTLKSCQLRLSVSQP